ncbi:hypothetical protein [Variovorax sp. GT1P44]|uniref:hypothetical protein n=1 Tax=Variovorax sp. GT1P44 TaxID=3443742 RepID=UPI003F4859DD
MVLQTAPGVWKTLCEQQAVARKSNNPPVSISGDLSDFSNETPAFPHFGPMA